MGRLLPPFLSGIHAVDLAICVVVGSGVNCKWFHPQGPVELCSVRIVLYMVHGRQGFRLALETSPCQRGYDGKIIFS
jgi:hypothetical protein